MIAEAGFSHTTLTASGPFAEQTVLPANVARYRELLTRFGLAVDSVHGFPALRLVGSNAEERAVAVAATAWLIEQAAVLGAPVVVVHHALFPFPDDLPRATCFEQLTRAFTALLEGAGKHGIQIALENLPTLDNLATLDALFERLPDLRFCFDAGHANLVGSWDLLPRHGDRLVAVHLHDNDGLTDRHLFPGDGTVPWPRVMDTLRACGYSGVWSLEVIQAISGFPGTPREVTHRAYERLLRVLR